VTSRERVLAALNHCKTDRVPRLLYGELIGYTPAIEKLLKEKCTPKTAREYFDMDMTGIAPNATKLDINRLSEWLPVEAQQAVEKVSTFSKTYGVSGAIPVDEWGVWWRQGSFYHFAHIESPLKMINDMSRIKEFPWPDLDSQYRYEGLSEKVHSIQQAGVAVAAFAGSIFEQAWYIRGMEQLLEDMLLNPEIANFIFERTAYYQKEVGVNMAKTGVDMIMLGDDVAMQNGLIMKAETWREFLKPRLQKTIRAIKEVRPEVKIFYHSDGNVEQLIPELIEVGVDVLNPVQPECMNPSEIKQKYGDKLAFLGTVSVQQTMPYGSVNDVKMEVEQRIKTVGRNGGLVLAPAHVLGPEVQWENIVAFFEACG